MGLLSPGHQRGDGPLGRGRTHCKSAFVHSTKTQSLQLSLRTARQWGPRARLPVIRASSPGAGDLILLLAETHRFLTEHEKAGRRRVTLGRSGETGDCKEVTFMARRPNKPNHTVRQRSPRSSPSAPLSSLASHPLEPELPPPVPEVAGRAEHGRRRAGLAVVRDLSPVPPAPGLVRAAHGSRHADPLFVSSPPCPVPPPPSPKCHD